MAPHYGVSVAYYAHQQHLMPEAQEAGWMSSAEYNGYEAYGEEPPEMPSEACATNAAVAYSQYSATGGAGAAGPYYPEYSHDMRAMVPDGYGGWIPNDSVAPEWSYQHAGLVLPDPTAMMEGGIPAAYPYPADPSMRWEYPHGHMGYHMGAVHGAGPEVVYTEDYFPDPSEYAEALYPGMEATPHGVDPYYMVEGERCYDEHVEWGHQDYQGDHYAHANTGDGHGCSTGSTIIPAPRRPLTIKAPPNAGPPTKNLPPPPCGEATGAPASAGQVDGDNEPTDDASDSDFEFENNGEEEEEEEEEDEDSSSQGSSRASSPTAFTPAPATTTSGGIQTAGIALPVDAALPASATTRSLAGPSPGAFAKSSAPFKPLSAASPVLMMQPGSAAGSSEVPSAGARAPGQPSGTECQKHESPGSKSMQPSSPESESLGLRVPLLGRGTARAIEERLMSRPSVEQLVQKAPFWIVLLSLEAQTKGRQTVHRASEMMSLFQQGKLHVQTLLVGVSAGSEEAAPTANLPPSVFRPLQYLVALLHAGGEYVPLSQEDADRRTPPSWGWCIPACLFPKGHIADNEGGVVSASTEQEMQAQAMRVLKSVPYWGVVQSYNERGGWRASPCMCSAEAQRQFTTGALTLMTPVVGASQSLHKSIWLPTTLLLPLGALVLAAGGHAGRDFRSPTAFTASSISSLGKNPLLAVSMRAPEDPSRPKVSTPEDLSRPRSSKFEDPSRPRSSAPEDSYGPKPTAAKAASTSSVGRHCTAAKAASTSSVGMHCTAAPHRPATQDSGGRPQGSATRPTMSATRPTMSAAGSAAQAGAPKPGGAATETSSANGTLLASVCDSATKAKATLPGDSATMPKPLQPGDSATKAERETWPSIQTVEAALSQSSMEKSKLPVGPTSTMLDKEPQPRPAPANPPLAGWPVPATVVLADARASAPQAGSSAAKPTAPRAGSSAKEPSGPRPTDVAPQPSPKANPTLAAVLMPCTRANAIKAEEAVRKPPAQAWPSLSNIADSSTKLKAPQPWGSAKQRTSPTGGASDAKAVSATDLASTAKFTPGIGNTSDKKTTPVHGAASAAKSRALQAGESATKPTATQPRDSATYAIASQSRDSATNAIASQPRDSATNAIASQPRDSATKATASQSIDSATTPMQVQSAESNNDEDIAELVPISHLPSSFSTVFFRLFCGPTMQHAFTVWWWLMEPQAAASVSASAAAVAPCEAARGPYSGEQMLLAFITMTADMDCWVCATAPWRSPNCCPPAASCFRPLTDLLDDADEGRSITIVQLEEKLNGGATAVKELIQPLKPSQQKRTQL